MRCDGYWRIYCEAAWRTVLIKYSTMEFTDGNSCSSKVKDWEKSAQSACLVIQFGCLDTYGYGV
jgi:hypothetical protein